jgi:hypothetical protein
MALGLQALDPPGQALVVEGGDHFTGAAPGIVQRVGKNRKDDAKTRSERRPDAVIR